MTQETAILAAKDKDCVVSLARAFYWQYPGQLSTKLVDFSHTERGPEYHEIVLVFDCQDDSPGKGTPAPGGDTDPLGGRE